MYQFYKKKKSMITIKNINNLRYVDSIVILVNSSEGLQRLIEEITKEGDTLGLKN